MVIKFHQPFSKMRPQEREAVRQWAVSHDWGSQRAPHFACAPDYKIVVYGSEFDANDVLQWDVPFSFETWGELRDWAGY